LNPGDQIQTHFLAQNHSFDLGNEDAEEEEHRIVQNINKVAIAGIAVVAIACLLVSPA